jgi:hypothetical protein
MIRKGQANLQQARKAQRVILQAAVAPDNDPEDDVNRQELGNSFVWEAVAGGSTPLLHHSDAAFSLWDMPS